MRTILLVEDDFLNRRLLKKILSEYNFQILEAKNAVQAIKLLENESIDLVILDINLGENEQDGISIGKVVESNYEIPFIYLTAYYNQETISKAIATKPYSYLTKPFKNADLIASVKIAMSQSVAKVRHSSKILVKDDEYNVEILVENINYIESDGNYLSVNTDEKTYKCRSTIKKIMVTLPETSFVQTHRGFIVNKHKIEKFNLQNIIVNDTVIPVTKTFAEFINKLDT